MLDTIFATKGGMTQVWTKQGKRLPVTKCVVNQNAVLGLKKCQVTDRSQSSFSKKTSLILEIGYGKKKLKNTSKPLRAVIEKSGFSDGFKKIYGVRTEPKEVDQISHNDNQDSTEQNEEFKVGDTISLDKVLSIGDVVKVQGLSKGRGFSGVIKRHGMSGGPKTQGQSDRSRAVGSIGSQTPGKVWKGKRMPGHHGVEKITVANLVVVHLDANTNEVWLSGPVPGHLNSTIRIVKTGQSKALELDNQASGIPEANNIKSEPDLSLSESQSDLAEDQVINNQEE